jgi:hypothetical protein
MRAVVIHFPDNIQLEAFLSFYKVGHVDVSRRNHSLRGFLTEKQIIDALLYYEGELQVMKPVRSLYM